MKTAATAPKSRRVRTGCLTCRQRHLKCDEALPDCFNCRRSKRQCKRGLRLNFLETMVHVPSGLASSPDWTVGFVDESLHIASEYRGGLKRYSTLTRPIAPGRRPQGQQRRAAKLREGYFEESVDIIIRDSPVLSNGEARHKFLDKSFQSGQESAKQHNQSSETASIESLAKESQASSLSLSRCAQESTSAANVCSPENMLADQGQRDFIGTQEELDFMRAFVDGVGTWMDSLDYDNHFSQEVPCRALASPMLLNALLACGAKHLALSDPRLDDRAECYYNTATSQLLRSLQNRDRDSGECAAASIILCVYEVLSDKPAREMNHISGAKMMIKDCGWNATGVGMGSACFWFSVGLEVLCCLATNWLPRDPDEWGLDMDWVNNHGHQDSEQAHHVWLHRAFYIVAKAATFRARTLLFLDTDPHDQQARLASRLAEWQHLKWLCEVWDNQCPRSMHPVGYLPMPDQKSHSSFPRFWLTRHSGLLARLFYHAAQCILTATHPIESSQISKQMKLLQLHHARQVLGLVASSRKDNITSIAIQTATMAAEMLMDRSEQVEASKMLEAVRSKSDGRIRDAEEKLMREWMYGPCPNFHQKEILGPIQWIMWCVWDNASQVLWAGKM
ncbi:hypothetical protein CDD81_1889 [Ophiocordyceps australis]|uniref:Zn(2)-C6 fungal-type domain-containing protein n=1 Tax=Ophiocordyceps australis TaxID=1399860 RepID=A0A2C5X7W1_9HYPO|nr:hypothetical protein CDD81_1889 [Ophiocordyceps australis]